MRRFGLLLRNEFQLFKTAPAVHLIAVLQPALMFILMSTVMVVPTFKMRIFQPEMPLGLALLEAMDEVRSPIGANYIEPVIVDSPEPVNRQVILITTINDKPTALQRYGYIDSNLVKNLRNRLTAALLVLWNTDLDGTSVHLNEHPWLPKDVPYRAYFGMAIIPLAAYLAAAMIGGYLTAQEYEQGTTLIYRLSPVPFTFHLGAKLFRSLIIGLAAGGIQYLTMGVVTGVWASSFPAVIVILIPFTLLASCIGVLAGLLTRSTLPSFLISLASAFLFWLIGSGFGLAAGFSPIFEAISRLIPNTVVVEMLFPYFYYGRHVAAHPLAAALQLAGYTLSALLAAALLYRREIKSPRG